VRYVKMSEEEQTEDSEAPVEEAEEEKPSAEEGLDAEKVEKINNLATSLRNSGLVANMADAVEKAKDIVLGPKRKKDVAEMEKDLKQVEEDLKDPEDDIPDVVKAEAEVKEDPEVVQPEDKDEDFEPVPEEVPKEKVEEEATEPEVKEEEAKEESPPEEEAKEESPPEEEAKEESPPEEEAPAEEQNVESEQKTE